jgi:glycosyltransferase involved in cell wall biosynthesis
VVATEVGGVPELLGEGRGQLVGVGEAGSVASAVERLLADPELWLACSRAGQAHVATHHRLESMIAGYRGLYDRWVR